MSQPIPALVRSLRSPIKRSDIDKLWDVIRVLDRSVVEISMHIYNVPRRQRAIMREQHRRLHETIRRRMPHMIQRQSVRS